MTTAEIICDQGKLIRIQSEIIDKLALVLMQHESITEEQAAMIKNAAKKKEQLEEAGGA